MKNNLHKILLFLTIFIIIFSVFFLSCLTANVSIKNKGYTYYYLWHQIYSGIIPGILLGLAAYFIPLTFFKRWAPLLVFLNILVMFAVFIPGIGARAGGATRWINIGPINFQPAEFLKITAILYISAWITSKILNDKKQTWQHKTIYVFAPFAVFLGLIVLGLLAQKDLSTLGILSFTLVALYFSSKTPFWHSVVLIVSGFIGFTLFILLEPYRLSRVMAVLNPSIINPLGAGLQSKQSEIALGSGGLFGKGLGMSSGKYFIPEAKTDSIFAVIGEELGLLGCLVVILIFILLFWIGIKIAKNSHDTFSQILSIGIVFYLGFQALVNMASATGVFPLAGIPLPFFSYGGSHVAVELFCLGLLLNIVKNKTHKS